MSDTQQNRATLSRNFIAQQSCMSDIGLSKFTTQSAEFTLHYGDHLAAY